MVREGWVWLFWALLLLTLPLNWLIAAAVAAAFHEGCHYAALRLLGGRAVSLRIGLTGAVMDISPMEPRRELVCALAGPVGGLLPVLLYRTFPRLALCALVQSAYNLLPLWPLDGGRAVRCLLALLLPRDKAERVSLWVEAAGCTALFLAGLLLRLGAAPVFLGAGAILRGLYRKIPCNAPQLRVQ